MMYKVPFKLVAIVRPDPSVDATEYEPYARLADALDAVEKYGFEEYSVGSLLCVYFRGRYWVTTYYWQTSKRDAEFDAARNGFPFYADENDRGSKVGLLARLYRAIIA